MTINIDSLNSSYIFTPQKQFPSRKREKKEKEKKNWCQVFCALNTVLQRTILHPIICTSYQSDRLFSVRYALSKFSPRYKLLLHNVDSIEQKPKKKKKGWGTIYTEKCWYSTIYKCVPTFISVGTLLYISVCLLLCSLDHTVHNPKCQE